MPQDAPHISNFLYVAQNPQEWVHDQDPPRASPQFSDLPCCPALHRHTHRFDTLGGGYHHSSNATGETRHTSPTPPAARIAFLQISPTANDAGQHATALRVSRVLEGLGLVATPTVSPTRIRVRAAVAANAPPHRDSVAATRDLTDEILQQCKKA